jgi:hypothetical protein
MHRHPQSRHGRKDWICRLGRPIGADATAIVRIAFALCIFFRQSLGPQIAGGTPVLAHGFGEGRLGKSPGSDETQSDDEGLAHFHLLFVFGGPVFAACTWFELF